VHCGRLFAEPDDEHVPVAPANQGACDFGAGRGAVGGHRVEGTVGEHPIDQHAGHAVTLHQLGSRAVLVAHR
jgi:hypothetical protein